MIDLLKILAVALITVFAHMILKQTRPEIAMILSIAGSVLIVIMVVDSLSSVISSFYEIFERTGGANICYDAGASSVADKILFAGKVVILLISLPIIKTVIDMVVAIL